MQTMRHIVKICLRKTVLGFIFGSDLLWFKLAGEASSHGLGRLRRRDGACGGGRGGQTARPRRNPRPHRTGPYLGLCRDVAVVLLGLQKLAFAQVW